MSFAFNKAHVPPVPIFWKAGAMARGGTATYDARLDDLLCLMAKGDRGAFQTFYEATARRLLPVAQAILRDRERAQDILQDAYIRMFERAWQFDPERGAAMAWAVTVTRRLALNAVRAAPVVMVSISENDGVFDVQDDTISRTGSTFEPRLGDCLRKLSVVQREAIIQAYVFGLTHDELAERLSTPLGTVKSWIRRGLGELKECLQ
ncbi:MAG: sigma-70 family RNA polymerase sigma factor [Beijerinckiaceae bacterium]